MRKHLLIFLGTFILWSSSNLIAQNAFNKGVNITGWFSAGNAKSIPFTKFTKKDFENIKSLGCDVIRLPIALHYMTNGEPDYVIDTLFYKYLDTVIGWADDLQISLIIDNHTIEVAKSKNVEIPLLKIWSQMANHYKEFSNRIYFEILNEPNTLLASDWAKIQAKVVDTIRKYDSKHTILVSGADWGGIYGLKNLKKLADTNLIYSFHFYDPMLFTHQGASWTSPSMIDLAGVPFPYDASRMPACPASLKGTWIESNLNTSYKTDASIAKLKSTIDEAVKYANDNGVKIFCGEFGVYNLNSPELDRVEWYKTVTRYLSEKEIPWTMWDYQGGFGIFNKGSDELFEYDLNRPMADSMGFTLPPFQVFIMKPDSVAFDIYTDFLGENILGGAPGSGMADLTSTDAYKDDYAIYITEFLQYNALDFDFKYNKDLSELLASNFVIDFWIKGDSPASSITLRFLDTKTSDPKDHPWRRDFTVNSTVIPFDTAWHNLVIPLKKFFDAGSWDGSWFNSTNSFDWKAVDRFQIVSEKMALTGKKFWFDNIRIKEGTELSVKPSLSNEQAQLNIFPNPASENINISYNAASAGDLSISIYSITGQKIVSLFNNKSLAGENVIVWNLTNDNQILPDGIYLCRVKFNNYEITKKISILRNVVLNHS